MANQEATPEPVDMTQQVPREWQAIHQLANQLAAAWTTNDDVDLRVLLPPIGHPERVVALRELVRADLEIRWQRARGLRLEQYIERYPELGPATALPAELVYEEFRIRQWYGDRPSLESFQTRFPTQHSEVCRRAGSQKLVPINPAERPTRMLPPESIPPTHGDLNVPQPPPFEKTAPPQKGANTSDFESSHLGTKTSVPEKPEIKPNDSAPNKMAVWAADQARKENNSSAIRAGGAYSLLQVIGAGAFGKVWRAEAPGGVEVAVKVLDQNPAQTELQALELIKKLRHPFLLQTQAYWATGDQLYIAMELADQSLGQRCDECKKAGQSGIPRDELIGYFKEAAEALDFLHSKSVLHRDIKPANILLLKQHVKVADFGLARLLFDHSSLHTMNVAGTPMYMGPEVWRGIINSSSDQYSLAATYYELRVGRRLFRSTTPASLMYDHIHKAPDFSQLPAAEKQVLARALSKEPARRYPTCTAFATELQKIIQDEQEAKRRPRRAVVYGGLIILFVGVLASLLLLLTSVEWPPPFTLVPTTVLVEAGGESVSVEIPTQGQWPPPADTDEPPIIKIGNSLAGIQVTAEPLVVGQTPKVNLLVDPNVMSGLVSIPVRIEWGNQVIAETDLSVTIAKPDYYWSTDPNWRKPHEAAIVTDLTKTKYVDRIDIARGTDLIRFRLIPKMRPTDPSTFYIMETKVWVSLYRQFAQQNKESQSMAWLEKNPGFSDDCPVMGVMVKDAYQFARWLAGPNGNLPTLEQWDKASGAYEEGRGQGPFRGVWKDGNPLKLDLAIGSNDGKPRPVGTASHDISCFFCRDMAGNGREWTRSLEFEVADDQKYVSPDLDNRKARHVRLRGESYRSSQPFLYPGPDALEQQTEIHTAVHPYIGFRVVVER